MKALKWWLGWVAWQPSRLRWAIVRWLSGMGKTDEGYFDVQFYGADKEGKRDSTYAVQDAINAAQRDGGATWLPPGNFVVSSTLTMTHNELPSEETT